MEVKVWYWNVNNYDVHRLWLPIMVHAGKDEEEIG